MSIVMISSLSRRLFVLSVFVVQVGMYAYCLYVCVEPGADIRPRLQGCLL